MTKLIFKIKFLLERFTLGSFFSLVIIMPCHSQTLKSEMTVDQIKQYFTNHIKVIDPIEGIWLRHLKTRTYLKGEEIPKFNTIDTQIVIFREEEAFKCYYLNSTLGHEVYDLVILNSAVDNLYFCTYNSDFFKFFGECTFVNQSFKIVGNQFEVNYEMECLKKDHGYVYNGITEYFGTYEKLFPK